MHFNDLTSKDYIPFMKSYENRLLNLCNKNEGKPQAKMQRQNIKIFLNGICITFTFLVAFKDILFCIFTMH